MSQTHLLSVFASDYCIPEVLMPIEKAEIDILPSISWGGDVRPLGICAGDCDTHDDCADGLACFVHEANMAVPGCSGGEDNDSLTGMYMTKRSIKFAAF